MVKGWLSGSKRRTRNRDYHVHSPKKDDNGTIINRGFFKSSRVFNIAQTDFPIETLEAPSMPIASAEAFIERLAPKTGRGDCAYSPGADTIYMPPITAFTDGESYYASFFMNSPTGLGIHPALIGPVLWIQSGSVQNAMHVKN
jgi:antirestriction protein ArdC